MLHVHNLQSTQEGEITHQVTMLLRLCLVYQGNGIGILQSLGVKKLRSFMRLE